MLTAWALSGAAWACDNPTASSFPTSTAITAGARHTCALDADGAAFCWGDDAWGQLGNGADTADATLPVAVSGGVRFASITAGRQHTCALTTAGRLLCWGFGAFGQLGIGTTATAPVPMEVLGGRRWIAVSAGDDHTCAIADDQRMFCWGDDGGGQLGRGVQSLTDSVPRAVTGNLRFVAVEAGSYHTCAVAADRLAFCWGWQGYGAVGDGAPGTYAARAPRPVAGDRTYLGISAGERHTCGITTDSVAYCWGGSAIGVVSPEWSSTPVAVSGSVLWRSLAAGEHFTCAIASGGAALCWGDGQSGVLGVPGTVFSPVPLVVTGGLRFKAITTGLAHACGVTMDGGLYCWGSNTNAQLGDGSHDSRTAPTLVVLP